MRQEKLEKVIEKEKMTERGEEIIRKRERDSVCVCVCVCVCERERERKRERN